MTIDRHTGRLAGVRVAGGAVSLTNGPAPAVGAATLTGLSCGAGRARRTP